MRRPSPSADTRPHRASRLLVVLAALALVAAACGDDDAIEIEGASATGSEDPDGSADDVEDPAEEEGAAGDETDGVDEDGTDEDGSEAAEEGGLAEHRPSTSARAAIDCDAVSAGPVGAVIVFPDSDDPATLEAGPGPVTVEVVGCSDTFEANVQYDVFHGQNSTPTLSGFTMGGTLGDWDVFSFEETYWTPGDWTVVMFVDDAESGDRVEYDQVTFTVD